MKTDELRAVACIRLVGRLLAEARDRKRRVRERMSALRGDDVRTPSRGPLLPNGRKCIRWHFYEMAKANHRMATEEVAVLSPPNAMIGHWKDVSEGRIDIDDVPVPEDIVPCTLRPDGGIATENDEWSPEELNKLNKQRNT